MRELYRLQSLSLTRHDWLVFQHWIGRSLVVTKRTRSNNIHNTLRPPTPRKKLIIQNSYNFFIKTAFATGLYSIIYSNTTIIILICFCRDSGTYNFYFNYTQLLPGQQLNYRVHVGSGGLLSDWFNDTVITSK